MTSPTLAGSAILTRFDALAAFLHATRGLWGVSPFKVDRPAWTAAHPALAAALDSLDEAAVEALEPDPAGWADAPDPWAAWGAALAPLTALGPLPADVVAGPPVRRVKARKQAQVDGFAGVVARRFPVGGPPLVEGCAGRGHLGRALAARLDRDAVLLEIDPALAVPPEDRVRHVLVDVLADAADDAVPVGALVVGLHACGCLSDRLVALAEGAAAEGVVVAPCCPHRQFGGRAWVPRSEAGRRHDLPLGLDVLTLAVLDEVTSSPRRGALRRRELLVRVAIDRLARRTAGDDVHRTFPPLGRGQVDRPLAELVALVKARHGLPLPDTVDEDALLAEAHAAVVRLRALGLVRGLFKRALELWTLLDRAQGLVERGWEVEVGTFCRRADSPRDVAILATRPRRSA